MTDLSPAAQRVLDAFLAEWADDPLDQDLLCLAAALRTAALYCTRERRILMTIAEEIEGVSYGTYRCDLEANAQK